MNHRVVKPLIVSHNERLVFAAGTRRKDILCNLGDFGIVKRKEDEGFAHALAVCSFVVVVITVTVTSLPVAACALILRAVDLA